MAPESVAGSVVAVTGGAGFVGRRLVERLAEAGAARVVVLDRHADGVDWSGLEAPVDRHALTLGEASVERLRASLRDVRYLFHLAAEKHAEAHGRPSDILTANVLGTHSLFEAARDAGVAKTVFASSLYAYGRTAGAPMMEAEMPHPTTVYGISKLAGELLGAHFAERSGPAIVTLRYFFVFGPRQTALHGRPSLIPSTFARLARGEPPVVRGDGAQILDYVYVDDVVDATIRAMEACPGGETLNVGSGHAVPVHELIGRMQRVAGTSLAPLEEPGDATARTCRVASIDKIRRVLGWTPRIDLDAGLALTWASVTSGAG
jgi:UDP-glucose 4-epimerase